MKKAYFNWSSGKDSAFALYKILQQKEYNVCKLITNINRDFGRVSMHGLRQELLDVQAKSIGIELHKIYFPADVTLSAYNAIMSQETISLKNEGFEYAIFGDIFLEDLRAYRDEKLLEAVILGVYPLWKQNTKDLLHEFLNLGFKTIVVCVNALLLGKEFVGRVIDEQFIKDLPQDIDFCGENGEFHTFCFDGPIFDTPIEFEIGEKVLRSYQLHDNDDDNCHSSSKSSSNKNHSNSFWYCDLILKETNS